MSHSLTQNAVHDMFYNKDSPPESPKVQIISVKKVKPSTSADRFRVVISDGKHFLQGMLATQLNGLVNEGKLDKNTVVRLKQYTTQMVQNRHVVICLGIDVLETLPDKIGDPQGVETSNGGGVKPEGRSESPEVKTDASNGVTPAAPTANTSATSTSAKPPRVQVYPIEGLSPYANKWTIKARVTQKSDIRHFTSARGEGKLFNVNLLDDSGEIRATAFNDAVDRLYNILTEGDVYYISKARVNLANKKFSNLNNEYEIMFDTHTEVEKCTDTNDLPQIKFDFVDLSKLEELEKDATCDIVAVVKDVGELSQITTRATQKPVSKRDINLVDKSNYSVRMTLWNKQAENFAPPPQPIIAFRNVKVGDFGGRNLSMVSSSTMVVDPDIPEAHSLRGWFETRSSDENFQSFSAASAAGNVNSFKPEESRCLAQVRDDRLGMGETTDYFNTRATISYVKSDNLSYPACPTDRCNKKVLMEGDDQWRCEKCDMVHTAPQYRYIMSLSVSDYSGQLWLSAFNEVGETILGRPADEMERLRKDDEAQFNKVIADTQCKMYDFVCRAKADTFNDTLRVRYQIQTIKPVDWNAACNDLVKKIEQM